MSRTLTVMSECCQKMDHVESFVVGDLESLSSVVKKYSKR